jgi:hypothetical protein
MKLLALLSAVRARFVQLTAYFEHLLCMMCAKSVKSRLTFDNITVNSYSRK